MMLASAANTRAIMAILFFANLPNFYDRAIPGTINEPIRLQFGLDDLQLMAVGIGEACCSPVTGSLIGDLFPSDRRSRASG